jgi:hypothetical protein
MKRQVNITFQVHDETSERWEDAPIVYVLENVPVDKDIEELCHVISVLNNFATVRTTRLFLSDPVTSKVACRNNGGYYQGKETFYNKPKK